MPRLSLYRPNRTSDYQYIDRNISEMYTVGGLDIFCHKYMGPKVGDPGNADITIPVRETQDPLFIEDLLLLENRDRAYDPDIYVMRGVYRAQDIDFDLTQFGLFLNNDTLFITFHYNDMIDTFGRKLMSGDVLEFPNLKDYNPLNKNLPLPLPRYYVIQDAAFAQEGFSVTWLPHLWRVKATPLVNAQEYQDIMNQPFVTNNIWDPGNFYPAGDVVNSGNTYYRADTNVPAGTPIDAINPDTGQPYWTEITNPNTVGDSASTRNKDLALNDAILGQAEVEVPLSGYDITKFYILPTYPDGQPASDSGATTSSTNVTTSSSEYGLNQTPRGFGYTMGYLSNSVDPATGTILPPNGLPVTPGVSFPPNPVVGDYALRLDYFPNRLFRYDGVRWVKIDDAVRTGLDFESDALTQRASFVNNTYTVPTTDLGNIPSRQSLSQILKPLADNGDQGGHKPPNPPPYSNS